MTAIWTQEEEAARLRARFDALKAEKGVGQAKFARINNVPGGPSLLSQHIKNRRPINLEAATAYAKGFGCDLGEISPRLAKEVMKASTAGHATAALTFTAAAIGSTSGPTPAADYSPEALILAKWLDKLPPGKAKDDVFSACMELLNAAVRGNPEQTPAPAAVHRRGKQNA